MNGAHGHEITELLEPHAGRPIRAFLTGRGTSEEAEDAFWALIFGRTLVDHATAKAVARELVESPRTVGEVLTGWRPSALAAGPD